ncbi:MAG: hypothetical protein Solivirus5_17 [Solivirus sp.]|uniref:Uncharacterized protein n=1 Tax=Solivirus sp. TaxID=2487772 RepID=A0A3G5AK28_9VIRU|nr:MAG: hypothetical protein Solivirus5_17 [Solivirus sp.]
MSAEVGNHLLLTYKGEKYLLVITSIIGSTLYLQDFTTKEDTSLKWNQTTQTWSLPNGETVPYSEAVLFTRGRSLPGRAPNYRFTEHELTDLELFKQFDHETFLKACSTSKYSKELCNGRHNNILYRDRIRIHYPEIYTDVANLRNVNWRELYFNIVRWMQIYKKYGGIMWGDTKIPINEPEIIVFFAIFKDLSEDSINKLIRIIPRLATKEAEDALIWMVVNNKTTDFDLLFEYGFIYNYVKLIEEIEKRGGSPRFSAIQQALLHENFDLFNSYHPNIRTVTENVELRYPSGLSSAPMPPLIRKDKYIVITIPGRPGEWRIPYSQILQSFNSGPSLNYLSPYLELDLDDLRDAINLNYTNGIKFILQKLNLSAAEKQQFVNDFVTRKGLPSLQTIDKMFKELSVEIVTFLHRSNNRDLKVFLRELQEKYPQQVQSILNSIR